MPGAAQEIAKKKRKQKLPYPQNPLLQKLKGKGILKGRIKLALSDYLHLALPESSYFELCEQKATEDVKRGERECVCVCVCVCVWKEAV